MKEYTADNIRNIAILGHGSEGKTTVVEAMLYSAGLIERMGKTEEGNTAMDFDPEEIKRGVSISMSMAPIEWKGVKINVLDIPGYFDMIGEMVGALRVVEGAVIVVGAVSGLAVGAEKAMDACAAHGIARIILVNQMDRENANFSRTLQSIQDKYGPNVVPLQLPIMEGTFKGYVDVLSGKAYRFDAKGVKEADVPADLANEMQSVRESIMEAAASADEKLMEKFFEEGELSPEEITQGMKAGMISGDMVPVLCGDALLNQNISTVLDTISNLMPAPIGSHKATNRNGDEITVKMEDGQSMSALVFKTMADNFVGKISYIKVMSGVLTDEIVPMNMTSGKTEKLNHVFTMFGKKQMDVPKLHAGDIGALIKLQSTNTSDTLCDAAHPVIFPPIEFPEPVISFAIASEKQGEEDKVFGGLHRLEEEDPTFHVHKHPDTGETLLSGQGEMHLDIIANKLKTKFGVSAVLTDPQIAYRETIRKTVEAQGRHKKQSGGHGQFGDCWIRFEPIMDGGTNFEFVDAVVGGVIPKQYIPAVEKGLRENIVHGVLAGFPVVGLRCTVYDGSYHSVDSSEMAFKTAARLAFRKGCMSANPVLLEPIARAEVSIPNEYMGDIIGDMNRRRGRILDMKPGSDDMREVVAEVPISEMFKYATDLRSMTQARGNFRMEVVRYDEVPSNIAQKIIENAKKEEEEEE